MTNQIMIDLHLLISSVRLDNSCNELMLIRLFHQIKVMGVKSSSCQEARICS